MKSTHVSRNLCAISAFLAALSFLDWSTASSNDSVFLVRYQTGYPPGYTGRKVGWYFTIDYSRKTVVTSEIDDTKPTVDAAGRTSQPAQISESKVVWQLSTKRAGGVICTQQLGRYAFQVQ